MPFYPRRKMQGSGAYSSRPVRRVALRGSGAYSARPVRRAPVRRRASGAGRYRGFDAPALGQGLGSATGAVIGSAFGGPQGGLLGGSIGGFAGKALGQGFKSLTGFGEYNIGSNSLVYPDRVIPTFSEDGIRVTKREYICDIDMTTAFSINSFPIQPGLDTTFPWLSAMASLYSQYRFNGLVFQLVSTSSEAIASSTNLGLGQVVIATNYDATDDLYQNLPQAMGSMYANSGTVSGNILHAIECAPDDQAQKLFYVRTGDNPAGTDLRLFDLGVLQVCTKGSQADYPSAMQLWVSYDITFQKSVMNTQIGSDLNTDKFQFLTPSASANYFGANSTRETVLHSNLGCVITPTKISFPPPLSAGYFLVQYNVVATGTTVIAPALALVNCNLINCYYNDAFNTMTNAGSISSVLLLQFVVKLTDRDASITFSGATLPISCTHGDLVITQVNGELYGDL